MSAVVEAGALARHYAVRRGALRAPVLLRALDGVSFNLAAGRTLAVVGESGSGKSTLARLITLVEPPSSGKLRIDGIDAIAPPRDQRRRLRRTVQMVFQDPYGSLNPRQRVRTIIGEPLAINSDLSAGQRRDRVAEVAAKVGLRPEQLDRYPHMFSGGQRQRIAIARALILTPRVVVADEPVSALDVSVQAQVLNLMMDLQAEFKLAYLFVSHDLGVVHHIAHDVLVLYLGRPVEQGAKEAIFAAPAHPYTRALLSSRPAVEPQRRGRRELLRGELPSPLDPPSGCAFRTRCRHATDLCTQSRPELRPFKGRLVACHHAERLG
jgi:dipeptide transport system ATP-binding protein